MLYDPVMTNPAMTHLATARLCRAAFALALPVMIAGSLATLGCALQVDDGRTHPKGSGAAGEPTAAGESNGAGEPRAPHVLDERVHGDDVAGYGAYPAGPYGHGVGDIVSNLQWEGYVDEHADAVATTKPWRHYSMDDVRRSGMSYALIHSGDDW